MARLACRVVVIGVGGSRRRAAAVLSWELASLVGVLARGSCCMEASSNAIGLRILLLQGKGGLGVLGER